MNLDNVVYDYDFEQDSLFVYCIKPYKYEVSLELDNDVTLDLDVDNNPVAFEFLNVSKLFNLEKIYFKNLVKINIQTIITENAICLKVQLIVMIHNESHVFDLNRISSNLNNIPIQESELVTV